MTKYYSEHKVYYTGKSDSQFLGLCSYSLIMNITA